MHRFCSPPYREKWRVLARRYPSKTGLADGWTSLSLHHSSKARPQAPELQQARLEP